MIMSGKTKKMINKKLEIEGVKGTRVILFQTLDEFVIILEEKIGIEYKPLIKKTHIVTEEEVENFDVIGKISDVLLEYVRKKQIEEKIGEIITAEGFDYISFDEDD